MIIFSNPGTLDPRCITVSGLNVKPDNPNAFGQFGTGLKYAIAVLLREGCQIEIYSGEYKYEFFAQQEEVRGKEFGFIHMSTTRAIHNLENGVSGTDEVSWTSEADQVLGFTTDLGKHWELWMAYRELWSNCMDEGGTVWQRDDDGSLFTPSTVTDGEGNISDWTTIIVSSSAFDEVHRTRSHFLLDTTKLKPLSLTDKIEIYDNQSAAVFYQGIRVMTLPKVARYTYNIHEKLYLSEDRQASSAYSVMRIIAAGFMAWSEDNTAPLVEVLEHKRYGLNETYEQTIDWKWADEYTNKSRKFLATVAELRRSGKLRQDAAKLAGRGGGWWANDEVLVKALPTETEAKWLNYDRTFLEALGFPEAKDFPVFVSEDVDESDGSVNEDDGLYIHPSFLERGKHRLIKTLIQEFLLHRDLKDQTISDWITDQWLIARGLKFKVDEPELEPEPRTVDTAAAGLEPEAD